MRGGGGGGQEGRRRRRKKGRTPFPSHLWDVSSIQYPLSISTLFWVSDLHISYSSPESSEVRPEPPAHTKLKALCLAVASQQPGRRTTPILLHPYPGRRRHRWCHLLAGTGSAAASHIFHTQPREKEPRSHPHTQGPPKSSYVSLGCLRLKASYLGVSDS